MVHDLQIREWLRVNRVGVALRKWAWLFIAYLSCYSVGGSVPIVFSYFSEFFSSRLRDTLIIGLASFWTVGRLYASFVAWVVIPRSISFHMGHMLITSWRVFLALCTLPCFLSALAIVFLTESPGFLFYVSTTVYRRVCVCNVYSFGVCLYSVVVLVMEVGIIGGNPLCVLCLCSFFLP